MRERIQRRKKKSPEQAAEPAPPPLQPAYFDADASPAKPVEAEVEESAPPVVRETSSREPRSREPRSAETRSREAGSEAQTSGEDEASAEAAEPTVTTSVGGPARRGRRRRGGRGRGGRGREQAVAQAFTPAAAKGITPEVAVAGTAEGAPSRAQSSGDQASREQFSEDEPQARLPRAAAVSDAVPAASPRPPKGIVVLAIGLPGSGKSSWFKRHNVVPLSSDMVRSLLFDDVREQRFQDLVFSNLRSMLKARLIAKRPMNYVDATNLTPQERQHWIKLAKDYNYEVQAVFFDVPLEVCLERHQRRDRVVPEDVMRRMAAKLKPPSFPEGFAKITVVRVKKKEE